MRIYNNTQLITASIGMIQLFVIFHKTIFDECYKNIPADILYKYFTFIAVNKNIPKSYTPNKYKVINEWDLPIYDSKFQELGYNENLAIYHVYINNIHKEYTYIGFFQYDMIFTSIPNILQTDTTETHYLFSMELHDFIFCSYKSWNEPTTLKFIINDYETYFNKKYDTTMMCPLYNTYIIPSKTYETIMKWVVQLYDKLYPWCIKPPNAKHFGHIGGLYERVMAYAISQEKLVFKNIGITHDHSFKRLSY